MDRSLFISMSGAKNAMKELEVLTNNLANVNTTAFRADSAFMKQYKVAEQGQQSRTYAKIDKTFTDFKQGPTINTERDLDLAIDGPGFMAVQSKTGKEGYTRAGSLQLGEDGTLMTQEGQLVLGNGGAINIPPAQRIHIGPDGTISAQFVGTNELVNVDRIKFTNPDVATLTKGEDGLFYLPDSGTAQQDQSVKVLTGALEGSNVNAIETMTKLIDLTRHYEIHTTFMKQMSEDTSKSNELLELRG